MRRRILGLTAVAAALIPTSGAGATPPGADGLIAYTSDSGGVTLIRPDGTGRQSFGLHTVNTYGWSPDGRRLVFRQFERPGAQLGVHDVVTGERILLDLPPEVGSPFFVMPLDVAWTADGRSLLASGVRFTFDPESKQTFDEALLYEWRDIAPGADPVLIASGGERVVRWLDVSAADGSLAAMQLIRRGFAFEPRLMVAPLSDPFGGTQLLGGALSGASYAPDGSSVIVWDDSPGTQSVLRVPANGGPAVRALTEPSGRLELSHLPEYTPSGRGILQAEVWDTDATALYWFDPSGPPDQELIPVPGTAEDVPRRDLVAVQPLARTALEVDPVLVRMDPLRLGLLTFRGRLTDRFGPVAGAPIRFTSRGGAAGCSGTTDARGVAECSATVPWAQALLVRGAEGRYAGDVTHTAATGSAGLAG